MTKDHERLRHILEQISYIEQFIQDTRDIKTLKATERCIEIIGEACRAISDELQSQYPEVPWRSIVGMRNILVHEYYQLDNETIWDIAENKIPALKDWIIGILEQLDD